MTRVDLEIKNLGQPISLLVHQGPDLVSREITAQKVWEPFETELLLARLGPGQVFVDVGANIGYYSVIADQLVGAAGSIYAFEPERKNFELLVRNLENCRCRDVNLHHAGLSDLAGASELYLSPENWGDHRISAEQGRSIQPIEMLCGDDLLAGKHIDFLKIDTQGAEYQVVNGLRNSIQANSAWLAMVIEYWPWGLAASGSSAEAFVELLGSFNMPIHIIDHLANRLIPAGLSDLLAFAKNTRLAEVPQGFVNIMLGKNVDSTAVLPD